MLIRPATPTAPPRGPGRHAAMQLATTKRAILRIARPVPVCVRGSAAYCKAAKIARSARDGGPTKAAARYDNIFCIVDLHSLTIPEAIRVETLRAARRELAALDRKSGV